MNHPLRVLILLPLILAGIYLPLGYIGFAYAEVAGDSQIMAPTSSSHSIGPDPLLGPGVLDISITLDALGPSPEDMDGWNLQGTLDPRFFRINAIQDGSTLDNECLDMGGNTLFRSSADLRTGEWGASELCFAGLPHPVDAGATTGGVLLTIQVAVVAVGCSSIDLDEPNSYLRDIDEFDSLSIPAAVNDGMFCNTADFTSDYSGQAVTVSPRRLDLGGMVGFHAQVRSTGAVSMIVLFEIERPDGGIDVLVGGPVMLSGNTEGITVDYTPDAPGFYAVQATSYWSEDGGAHYIYLGDIESRNLDFTVRE